MHNDKIPDDLCKAIKVIGNLANRFSNVDVKTNSKVEIASSSYFLKIWRGYEAALLLIKQGYKDEADYVIRTILETCFILKCLSDNPGSTIEKLCSDYRVRKDSFVNIAYQSPHFKEAIEAIREKPKNLATKGDTKVNIEEWAKLAGLEVFYDIPYRMLSNSSHSGIAAIDKYINMNDQDMITSVSCQAEDDDYMRSIVTLISVMIISLESIGKILGIDLEPDIEIVGAIIGAYA